MTSRLNYGILHVLGEGREGASWENSNGPGNSVIKNYTKLKINLKMPNKSPIIDLAG